MKEVIPIDDDHAASAIKVLQGPIEQYRLAASTSASERVRFRLDNIIVEAHPAEQNTSSEKIKALADSGDPVVAGVFQLHDGRHLLDWLIAPSAPTMAPPPIAVRAEATWKSFRHALQVVVAGSLLCTYAVYLNRHIESAWNILFGIIGLVAAIAVLVNLVPLFVSVHTIWHRYRRRRALRLMESIMTKYQSASPRTQQHLTIRAMHEY